MRRTRPSPSLQLQVWRVVREAFEARRREGLTQAELARRLRVSRGQVCVWMRGPETMTLKAASRLLAAMDAAVACVLLEPRPAAWTMGAARRPRPSAHSQSGRRLAKSAP